jgi:hypothetical protein
MRRRNKDTAERFYSVHFRYLLRVLVLPVLRSTSQRYAPDLWFIIWNSNYDFKKSYYHWNFVFCKFKNHAYGTFGAVGKEFYFRTKPEIPVS